ncbi:hypothetical protein, partial [Escherichia coli]|uniref:hypothetical protein n=1 Tax=Escherichia coli TaxID=562 RepID=UPI001A7E070B
VNINTVLASRLRMFDANDFPAMGYHGRGVRITIVNIDDRRINFWRSSGKWQKKRVRAVARIM